MAKIPNSVYSVAKQAVQKMIQREASEWPPGCVGPHFQPHRPDRPLVEVAEEKRP